MGQLLTPLRYLRIEHSRMRRYKLWYPLVGAIGAGAIVLWMGKDFNTFGSLGLVDHVAGLLRVMVGFFLTALGLMHSLAFPGLDEQMKGTPPTLRNSEGVDVPLTRRQFLRELFGFLVLLSLALYIYGLLAAVLRPIAGPILPELVRDIFRVAFCSTYVFLALNLLTATLLGLYFLTSRIGSDRAVIERKGAA